MFALPKIAVIEKGSLVVPKRAKRSVGGIIVIDGMNLDWHVQREPQWSSTDGWKGMSIAVRLAENKCRELLVEYPFKRRTNGMAEFPQRPNIIAKALETDVKAAMEAGWDPMSRGKVFAFQVAEKSN
jgi:hypothetical protein